jgi:hypothetical protein
MTRAHAVLFIALTPLVLTCSNSSGPDNKDNPDIIPVKPHILALSRTSALPTASIVITGTGFGSVSTLGVRFANASGYRLDVRPVAATDTEVSVCVPPFILAPSGDLGAGTVAVSIVRNPGNGETVSNAIDGFRILDLPTPVAVPGTITLNFLNNIIAHFDTIAAEIDTTKSTARALKLAIGMEIATLAKLATLMNSVVTESSWEASMAPRSRSEKAIFRKQTVSSSACS